jgi:carbonic anhydrase/acetyltransferase-like protein (isoleucine patch superfamily)
VLRGDNEPITVGARTNIQEGAMLHADPGMPCTVGEGVTVGHHAILHGCTVGDGSLIGMGATVLNRAKIGKHCIVGANALVTEGKEFPDFSLIVGSPAKVVRTLDPSIVEQLKRSSDSYVANWKRFAAKLRVVA